MVEFTEVIEVTESSLNVVFEVTDDPFLTLRTVVSDVTEDYALTFVVLEVTEVTSALTFFLELVPSDVTEVTLPFESTEVP